MNEKSEDFLDMVRAGVNGTVADFSAFNIQAGENFMPIKSKETVTGGPGYTYPKDIEDKKIEEVVEDKKERPGEYVQGYLNPSELKDIAIKLLPNVGIEQLSEEEMSYISENAIKLAFNFLNVYNEVVQVERG